MALDPRIPLGVQPVQLPQNLIPNPLEQFGQMLTLRGLMEQNALRKLQAQREQQQIDLAQQESQRMQAFSDYLLSQENATTGTAPAAAAAPAPIAPDLGTRPTRSPWLQPGYGEMVRAAPPAAAPATPEGFFPSVPPAPTRTRLPSTAQTLGMLGPKLGIPVAKSFAEIEREQRLARVAQLDAEEKTARGLASIAQGILNTNTAEGYTAGILQARSRGFINDEQARQYMKQEWNSPQTRASLQVLASEGITVADQRRDERERIKADIEKPGLVADTFRKQLERYSSIGAAKLARSRQEFDEWVATLDPEYQTVFRGATDAMDVRKRALKPEEFLSGERATATATETARHNLQIELPNTAADFARIIADPKSTPEQKAAAQQSLNLLAGFEAATRPPQQTIAGLTPSQNSTVQSIATRLDNHKVVQDYTVQHGRYQSMKNILDRGFGGGGDLALIYEFMRALDPQSVVRESEYASAAKSGNIFLGALSKFNGLLKETGGFMPEGLKREFLGIVEQKMGVARNQAKKIYESFGSRIDTVTGEPESYKRYLTDYANLFEEAPTATGAPGTTRPAARGLPPEPIVKPTTQVEVKAPNGKSYYFPTVREADAFKRRIGMK